MEVVITIFIMKISGAKTSIEFFPWFGMYQNLYGGFGAENKVS